LKAAIAADAAMLLLRHVDIDAFDLHYFHAAMPPAAAVSAPLCQPLLPYT